MNIVSAQRLSKEYLNGDITVHALSDVNFTIAPASFVAFVGPSGSGKSTLLNMIGCLDPPTRGKLEVVGRKVTNLSPGESAAFRGENIGFIFQDFNLIPILTVFENIEYPLIMVQNWPASKRKQQVVKMLEAVGMKDQADKYPGQISGGQKQRVATSVASRDLFLRRGFPPERY